MKYKLYLLLSALLLAFCCGCSVTEKPIKEEKQINGENQAVTEQKDPGIAAIFKNSRTTVKNNRFENDYIRIWRQKDEDGQNIWMQEKLDGTDKKQVSFGDYFVWLTNDWI